MIVEIWKCDSTNRFPYIIGAWFIKRFQSTDYTHYALRLDNGAIEFYDASLTSGVSKRSEKDFLRDYNLVGKPWEVEVGSYIDFSDAVAPFIGKSYGLMQAIGIGLKWTLKWSKNPFANGPKHTTFATHVM